MRMINLQKLYLFKQRAEAEQTFLLQKSFRHEILHQKFDTEITMDVDLRDQVFFLIKKKKIFF